MSALPLPRPTPYNSSGWTPSYRAPQVLLWTMSPVVWDAADSPHLTPRRCSASSCSSQWWKPSSCCIFMLCALLHGVTISVEFPHNFSQLSLGNVAAVIFFWYLPMVKINTSSHSTNLDLVLKLLMSSLEQARTKGALTTLIFSYCEVCSNFKLWIVK